MLRRINLLIGCVVLAIVTSSGQGQDFHFKRRIENIPTAGWYSLPLPADLFRAANRDMSDLRIYQMKGSDTLEIPYLLHILNDVIEDEVIDLPAFNKSRREGKLYLTFELKRNQKVNHLDLEFEEQNFNGYVLLEGSADQKEWYTVDSLQRILSIHEGAIDFRATTLNFPLSNYRYLRLQIQADKALTIQSASFKKRSFKYGVHNTLVSTWTATTNKQQKETIIEVNLDQFQPVGSVKIETDRSIDFYRPITMEVLRDSTKTQKGWVYYYDPVYSGYITSLEDTQFEFPFSPVEDEFMPNYVKRLRITIQNADNQPVRVKSITVNGPQIELTAKLEPEGNYLFYGNPTKLAPSYDVVHFKEKIPESLPKTSLGPEENMIHPIEKGSPLFENRFWLWGIMAVIIVVLGYFTLKMMKAR